LLISMVTLPFMAGLAGAILLIGWSRFASDLSFSWPLYRWVGCVQIHNWHCCPFLQFCLLCMVFGSQLMMRPQSDWATFRFGLSPRYYGCCAVCIGFRRCLGGVGMRWSMRCRHLYYCGCSRIMCARGRICGHWSLWVSRLHPLPYLMDSISFFKSPKVYLAQWLITAWS